MFSAALILALGAGVFALWNTSDGESVQETPLSIGNVSPQKKSLGPVGPARPSPVVAPNLGSPIENVAATEPVVDDGLWNDGEVVDTGPFIDADDDRGDYSSSPVSDVGDFLDPDAG